MNRFHAPCPRSVPAAAKAVVRALLILSLALGGSSCGPPAAPGRLSLELPGCPEPWRSLLPDRALALDIVRVDESGRQAVASALAFGSVLEVGAPEAEFAVFLAQPVGRGVTLKPAGAVYPLRAEGGRVALDFPGGWSAAFAARLCALDPGLAASFNYARLDEEAAARLPDPWLCPPEALAEIAATGRFSLSRIKARELFAVRLRLPSRPPGASSAWLPESPFAPPVPESAFVLEAAVPAGAAMLYRGDERLLLVVDGAGRADALLMPD